MADLQLGEACIIVGVVSLERERGGLDVISLATTTVDWLAGGGNTTPHLGHDAKSHATALAQSHHIKTPFRSRPGINVV
jgi:hypothetical protein